MIRTVCKIHFLAGLCPPAPSSERSSPSPSSYAFECNKNWTRHCCAQFLLTTITFTTKKKERRERKSWIFFVTSYKWFFSHVDCTVSSLCCTGNVWWLKGACLDAFRWQENKLRGYCFGTVYACCNTPNFLGTWFWCSTVHLTYLWQGNVNVGYSSGPVHSAAIPLL